MIKLTPIPGAMVGGEWGNIAEWVKSALGKDKSYLPGDIKNMCILGSLQLWIIYNGSEPTGFLTTSLNKTPQGLVCYCPWLGGENLGEWASEGFSQLKEWLHSQRCISVSWVGRKAWQKLVRADYEGVFYLINL